MKIKKWKNKINISLNGEVLEYHINNISQFETSSESYVICASEDNCIYLIDLISDKLTRIEITEGEFYTFEKRKNKYGVSIVLALTDRGSRFWQYEISDDGQKILPLNVEWR